jgi:hypothetical protein
VEAVAYSWIIEHGYQADFDKLPWKGKYDAKKSSEKP